MKLISNLLFLFFLLFSLTESADPLANFCNDNSKTDNTSQISRNIDNLLSVLVSGTVQNGFTATSLGEADSQIYGLSQCRGDVSKNDCSVCIKDAAESVRKLCPDRSDARITYDYCFLRYSHASFFGQVDTSPAVYYWNVENVTGVDDFNGKLGSLMDEIRSEAVGPAQNKGLGKGKSEVSPLVTLYALAQCTRDLSDINCAQCVAIAVGNFPRFCDNKRGCRVLYSSCYVRYELYPFFFPLDSEDSLVSTLGIHESFVATKP
ncbi:hypothetical protein ACP275_14G060500 [Erythranthe tilingii]